MATKAEREALSTGIDALAMARRELRKRRQSNADPAVDGTILSIEKALSVALAALARSEVRARPPAPAAALTRMKASTARLEQALETDEALPGLVQSASAAATAMRRFALLTGGDSTTDYD